MMTRLADESCNNLVTRHESRSLVGRWSPAPPRDRSRVRARARRARLSAGPVGGTRLHQHDSVASLELSIGLCVATGRDPGGDLGSGAEAQSGEDLLYVGFGGSDGDGQPGRDLPVGQSFRDQLRNLALPAGERAVG